MSTTAPSTMQVKREDLNASTVKLDVVCTPEQIASGFSKAARAFAKKMKVPGFRPGTAPQAVVEKLVDPEELARTAVETVVNDTLKKVMEDEGLKADNAPAVNVTKFVREPAEMEYTAKIPLPPVVEMGEYKGIEVSMPPLTVTDEEVERQIEDLQKRQGKNEAVVGRGIQSGDMAVVNLKAAGEEGDGKTFMVIAGQTFPGLDDALMGMGPEELKHAKLDFPATFQEKDWAGKSAETTITVRSVSSTKAPEMDDEFAKSLKANNMDDLRSKVREGVLRAKQQIAQEMMIEQLFDSLIGASKVVVPDTTWEQVSAQRLQETAVALAREKKTLEEYAKEQGMTFEELIEAQQTEAKTHVMRAVLIEKIFLKEEMKIGNDDANQHFMQIAAENQVPQDQLAKFAKRYGGAIRNEILFRAMHAKVVQFLIDNAKIVEGTGPVTPPAKTTVKSAKAPAKPAAKKKAKSEE